MKHFITRSIKKNKMIKYLALAASVVVLTALVSDYFFDRSLDAEAETTEAVVAKETIIEEKSEAAKIQMTSSQTDDKTTSNLLAVKSKNNSDYTISVYGESKDLYTSDRVNLRSGAGTEYDKLMTLNRGTSVKVTGETTNGWYQVLYNGKLGYIKADYVQEKPVATSYIFAGDSRTVQMSQAVNKSQNIYVAQVGEGYSYFVNTAIPQIDASISEGSVVIINYGVNDLYNVDKYIKKVNAKVDSWIEKGATVYYAAVLPVKDYPTITNAEIESFNSAMKSGLDSRVGWLDGYTYLQSNGFSTADGLHFNYDTYKSLYSYYMTALTL
ncbi:MAG: hypothetical protein E7302_04185 [Butyrivibrio sp.]|nr:hypothetical protein [Butyrivibrio sp.]